MGNTAFLVLACMGTQGHAGYLHLCCFQFQFCHLDRADVAVLKTPLAVCFFKGKTSKLTVCKVEDFDSWTMS